MARDTQYSQSTIDPARTASVPSLSEKVVGLDRLIQLFLSRGSEHMVNEPISYTTTSPNMSSEDSLTTTKSDRVTGETPALRPRITTKELRRRTAIVTATNPREAEKYSHFTLPDLPNVGISPPSNVRRVRPPQSVAPLNIIPRSEARRWQNPHPHEAEEEVYGEPAGQRTRYLDVSFDFGDSLLDSPLGLFAALAMTPPPSIRTCAPAEA